MKVGPVEILREKIIPRTINTNPNIPTANPRFNEMPGTNKNSK